MKPSANSTAKIGSNENSPPIPAWLSSQNRSAQPGVAANGNGREHAAAVGDASKRAGRDWQYDWDAAAPIAPALEGKQRRRLFMPRNSTALVHRGRPIARRLIISAACLAIVAAVGGGFLLISRHGMKQTAPVAAQIRHKKAPAVAEGAAAKSTQVKQAKVAEAASPKAAPPKASAGVNEAQKAAALPTRNKAATTVAQLPSPDSARWAPNVVPPDRALSNAHGGKPAAQSMAAFAPASLNAKSGPDAKPAQDNAEPAAEVKSASLTPAPKADDAKTGSIPNDDANAAEKARSTLDDVVRSSASKPAETGGRHAVVTTATNMRAGPENHSHVLLVVPAKASVELFSCDQWCKVAYDGHQGYIYKSFVSRSGHVHEPAAARRAPVERSKVASTDSGKLIGGAVVDNGAANTVASQPAAAAAPSQPAQPAAAQPAASQAAVPPTMGHDRH